METCFLCRSAYVRVFCEQKTALNKKYYEKLINTEQGLLYYRCQDCQTIFKDPSWFPSKAQEKELYDTHQNDSSDERYILHLRKLFDPLLVCLSESHQISRSKVAVLDYGCGPERALPQVIKATRPSMLEDMVCTSFDPLYFPGHLPRNHFSAVFCCEVAEHFHHPYENFYKMVSCLKSHGFLAVMTQSPPLDPVAFVKWYYHRDPSHVVFYSSQSFKSIAHLFGLRLMMERNGIVIFRRE